VNRVSPKSHPGEKGLDFGPIGRPERDFRLVEETFSDHGSLRGRCQLDGEGSAGTPSPPFIFNLEAKLLSSSSGGQVVAMMQTAEL